jgi:deoxyribose-phosphate aldolase
VGRAPLSRLAGAVDATLLVPWATPAEVERVAEEGCRFCVAAICVLPYHVRRCAAVAVGTPVAIAAAISFPTGGAPAAAKALEAAAAVASGARELDLVVNLGAARAGAWSVLEDEVRAVREACPGVLTKWIVEMDAVTEAEWRRAVRAVADGGGDFVKNATGTGPGGASVPGIRALRAAAGTMGVKAAGGIRSRAFALSLLEAGADRIGTSAVAALLGSGTPA